MTDDAIMKYKLLIKFAVRKTAGININATRSIDILSYTLGHAGRTTLLDIVDADRRKEHEYHRPPPGFLQHLHGFEIPYHRDLVLVPLDLHSMDDKTLVTSHEQASNSVVLLLLFAVDLLAGIPLHVY